ncbi:MAG: helix-turn-helix domain-containing protein [Lachnospiraceae bacterium]|nr:helix-turn-helix domain-containing protein [Lachnospiraceae bacterium]
MKHARMNHDSYCWNLCLALSDQKRAVVDLQQTGIRLRGLLQKKGISVSMLQDVLQLSCPQSIYHWFWGKTMPSIDHLVTISGMLGIPIEGLLVLQPKICRAWPQQWERGTKELYRRSVVYWGKMAG